MRERGEDKFYALVAKAERKGIMDIDTVTLSVSESIIYKLLKSTLPDIPDGTRAVVTFSVAENISLSMSLHVVLDNGRVWYDNAARAVLAESNTLPISGIVVRVYDERFTATKFSPSEGEMEICRHIIGMFLKDGTYYQGHTSEIAGEAASTDCETGELLPPEEGVTYVTTSDFRTSSRRDLNTLEVSYEDWWGDFCTGGHHHDGEWDHDHDDEDN